MNDEPKPDYGRYELQSGEDIWEIAKETVRMNRELREDPGFFEAQWEDQDYQRMVANEREGLRSVYETEKQLRGRDRDEVWPEEWKWMLKDGHYVVDEKAGRLEFVENKVVPEPERMTPEESYLYYQQTGRFI